MKRVAVPLVVLVLSAGLAHGGGAGFGPGFTQGDLADLTNVMGDVLIFPNLGGAAPGGTTGFEVLGAVGGPQFDTSAPWWSYVPHTNTLGGFMLGQRLIVRKGLPAGLDVGAQVGKALGETFWGGEVRWAFVESGTLSPAIGLRATYTRLDGSLVDRLDLGEVQLVASKGFLVVSPYGAIGYRRVSARAVFGDPVPLGHSSEASGVTLTVGAKLSVLPFIHLVGEVRRTPRTCVFVGAGVGL